MTAASVFSAQHFHQLAFMHLAALSCLTVPAHKNACLWWQNGILMRRKWNDGVTDFSNIWWCVGDCFYFLFLLLFLAVNAQHQLPSFHHSKERHKNSIKGIIVWMPSCTSDNRGVTVQALVWVYYLVCSCSCQFYQCFPIILLSQNPIMLYQQNSASNCRWQISQKTTSNQALEKFYYIIGQDRGGKKCFCCKVLPSS